MFRGNPTDYPLRGAGTDFWSHAGGCAGKVKRIHGSRRAGSAGDPWPDVESVPYAVVATDAERTTPLLRRRTTRLTSLFHSENALQWARSTSGSSRHEIVPPCLEMTLSRIGLSRFSSPAVARRPRTASAPAPWLERRPQPVRLDGAYFASEGTGSTSSGSPRGVGSVLRGRLGDLAARRRPTPDNRRQRSPPVSTERDVDAITQHHRDAMRQAIENMVTSDAWHEEHLPRVLSIISSRELLVTHQVDVGIATPRAACGCPGRCRETGDAYR